MNLRPKSDRSASLASIERTTAMTASQTNSTVGLRWTGHPLVDAGAAALAAFAGKASPALVTFGDVEDFLKFAEQSYLSGDLSKTVGVLFTINFLNPSFKDEQKRQRIRVALGGAAEQGTDDALPCVFCSRPALRILHRDDVPMLLGRGSVNFYPGGESGLPTCGVCQLALHGLTVGAPRCSGRALVVQTDYSLLLRLEKKWVADSVRFADLARMGNELPKVSGPRTRLIEALVSVQTRAAEDEVPGGIVAYHLYNGQGPGIEVYQLPGSVVRFLSRARSQRTATVWLEIERRGWQTIKGGRSASETSGDERLQYQNYVYEDLFRLPEEAARFIRIYFLRHAAGLVRSGDPRLVYNSSSDAQLINWDLTVLFLKEVLSMEQSRIDAIRELGDRLAEEIEADNDRRLFRNAYSARNSFDVRRLLIGASFRRANRQSPPIVSLDEYLQVFDEGDELARVDWRLAWDLTLIRIIEQLHQKGWLAKNKEEIESALESTDNDTTT